MARKNNIQNHNKHSIELNERLAKAHAKSAELKAKLEEKNNSLRELNRQLAEANALATELTAEIKKLNQELKKEIREHKKTKEAFKQQTQYLNERIKELNCLYMINEACRKKGETLEDLLRETVLIIPSGWQYSEITGSRMIFEGKEYKTKNFRETEWMQGADIDIENKKAGRLEVCYLEEKPEIDEGPFLKEERDLINAIAERLRQFIEHKNANEELNRSEEKYRLLVENATDYIFMIGKDNKVITLNKAAASVFRKQAKEVIGKSIFDLFPKEIAAEYSNNLKKLFDTGRSESYVSKMIAGGKESWLSVSLIPIRDHMGKVVTVEGVSRDITESKKANEALEKSEAKLKAMYEGAAEGILVADVESKKFEYANPAICRMLDYTEDELTRMSVIDIHPKDSLKHVISEFEAQARGEKTLAEDIPCLRKDGNVIYVDINTSSFLIDNKKKNVGFFTDITERKKEKEELKNSEERLKIFFEYAPDGYYINDLKGNFIDGNKAAEELTGYKREELIGQNMLKLKLLSPREIPKAVARLAQNIIGKPTGPDEFILNRKDGTQVAVEIRTYPVKIKGKTLVLGNVRDITERMKAQKALIESEAKYRDLVEKAGIAILTDDEEGNVVYANKKAEDLYGYTGEEIKKQSIQSLVHSDDLERIANHHEGRLQGKKIPTKYEFKGKKKNGSTVYIEADVTELIRDGKIIGTRIYLKDINERKKAEEQIKKSLEEKEILLKEIHHRVKNNMQIISSLLRIQAGNIKDEKIQEVFQALHDRIKSMSLLYQMLYQSEDLTRVDISEYVKNLTRHLVSMYRESVGTINLKLDVKDVYLDLKRAVPCGLIITELVSNSLKHAFSGVDEKEIAVEMHPNGEAKYILTVRDSGKGFPEAWDFREAESLGMKLVVDLVKQLNGTIELECCKGTEFKVVF